VRFDRYVDLALYGPDGFYIRAAADGGGAAGRRGDFITSPEVGPLFGEVLARYVAAEFERLGRPDDFEVVDVGAGPGTLARSLQPALDARVGRAVPYTAVEISGVQRERHPDAVASRTELPDRDITGVVLANELLDNLPFRLVVHDGGWREAWVAADGERLVEVLRLLDDELVAAHAWLSRPAPHGSRLPVQHAAARWVIERLERLQAGSVVVIDYATPRTEMLVGSPWRSWLRTYRGHERGSHYLSDPGAQDITLQVCVDQLPEPHQVRSQAQFLRRWGIDDLVDEGRAAWNAAATAPTVAALRMRSRIREAEALCDMNGLGGFDVLEWSR
jgi:SAM-dependent MidA family methyltransferase